MPTDQETTANLERVQALFVRHLPAVRAAILARLPNLHLAEDVVQETFLTVCKKAGSFELGTDFAAWACTIARYKVMEALRTGPIRFESLSEEAMEALRASEPAHDPGPSERLHQFERCMDLLAPKARQVMELRYRGEHLPEEISKRMGWTLGSVRVAISRARQLLQECVETRMKAREA